MRSGARCTDSQAEPADRPSCQSHRPLPRPGWVPARVLQGVSAVLVIVFLVVGCEGRRPGQASPSSASPRVTARKHTSSTLQPSSSQGEQRQPTTSLLPTGPGAGTETTRRKTYTRDSPSIYLEVLTGPEGDTVWFGNVAVGAHDTQTVQVLSSDVPPSQAKLAVLGANSGDFVVTNPSCHKFGHGSTECDAHVTFAPQAPGSREARLAIVGQPVSEQTELAGWATACPGQKGSSTSSRASSSNFSAPPSSPGARIALASSTVSASDGGTTSFGSVAVGARSVAALVIVSSSDSRPVQVQVAVAGTNPNDFVITDNSCSLRFGGTQCRVNVVFAPQNAGVRQASLVIAGRLVAREVRMSGIGSPCGTGP